MCLHAVQEVVVPMFEVVHVSQKTKTQVPLTNKCAGIFQTGVCHAKQVCVRVCVCVFIRA